MGPPVCREEAPAVERAIGAVTGDGKVHLSNEVAISKSSYDTLMALQKDSHFVKRAAVAIWSTEVLVQRSFTGTLSNRCIAGGGDRVPQKPLTPHKVDALKSIMPRQRASARRRFQDL
ncbi:BEN domain-containing protein 5-like [Ixodes scapularis]|uniref:BEN domain-containing protein 5-like n=1 Tax=Ixodes scapularis TaxID=6945 RepID=UPI001A9E11B9|nr:BEN domain-containing protein 5-like [Ixodes scapularis]